MSDNDQVLGDMAIGFYGDFKSLPGITAVPHNVHVQGGDNDTSGKKK